MRDQFAGVENAGKVSMESESVSKWPSCICVQSYSFSESFFLINEYETELYWIIAKFHYTDPHGLCRRLARTQRSFAAKKSVRVRSGPCSGI